MSKFGLEYREETGYDVGVYCEDNNWYFHQHYVEWLEQKIEALSQHDVIKNEVAVCEPHGCLDYSQGYDRCEKQCDRCKGL